MAHILSVLALGVPLLSLGSGQWAAMLGCVRLKRLGIVAPSVQYMSFSEILHGRQDNLSSCTSSEDHSHLKGEW